MVQLCRHLGVQADASQTLLDILQALLSFCHPKMKPPEMMRILRLRTEMGDNLQDILEVLEHGDLATEDDQRDLTSVRQANMIAKEEVATYTKEFVARERGNEKGK